MLESSARDGANARAPRADAATTTRADSGDGSQPAAVTLAWLVPLRSVAVVGQTVTILVAKLALGLELSLVPLGALVALTAVSNVVLRVWLARGRRVSARATGAVLLTDTLVLSGLLYFAGGPSNPFSALYLVHVTLAALALGIRWAGAVVAVAALGYAGLFFWHVPVPRLEHAHHDPSAYSVHLQGMWIAFAITASMIAYFVAKLAATVRAREVELAEAQQLASRNERLASLSTLAAGAAHELGTPLATIAIAAKELERTIASSPDEAIADAKLIRSEVGRCSAIVRRMATRTGETMGEAPEATTTSRVLDECKRRLVEAGDGDRVHVTPGEPGSFVGASESLVQILLSLVQNALHASRRTGAPVTLRAESGPGIVRFVVEDCGEGLPARLVPRVGEPFFTTKPAGEGMGLGLFLARSFAERCGGQLVFSSVEGEGTRVTLELPITGRHVA